MIMVIIEEINHYIVIMLEKRPNNQNYDIIITVKKTKIYYKTPVNLASLLPTLNHLVCPCVNGNKN